MNDNPFDQHHEWLRLKGGGVAHVTSSKPMSRKSRDALNDVLEAAQRYMKTNKQDPELVAFGRWCRLTRTNRDLSMGDLARLAGLSVTRVSAAETLTGPPATEEEMQRLREALERKP